MAEPGHIYVLINPSIDGLVKIGKTTREPKWRAKELSQATGVATPFYVAFSIEVADCHSAEEYVYAVLEHNGFNRSPNREFFEMPLQKAIEVLTLVQKELREQTEATPQTSQVIPSASEEVRDGDTFPQHPGAAILEKASNVYFGVGDEIKDSKEALRLLQQAKTLNFAPAFTSLADYFREEAATLYSEDENFDSRELREKALEVLKEGAQKGHGRCYAKMSELYDGYCWGFNLKPEPENANKCWKKYFRSATFINDDDRKWNWGLFLTSEGKGRRSRVNYAFNYLGAPGWRRAAETGRGFSRRARARHATGRRHGHGHRPPVHDAARPGKHPRRDPVPAVEAEMIGAPVSDPARTKQYTQTCRGGDRRSTASCSPLPDEAKPLADACQLAVVRLS